MKINLPSAVLHSLFVLNEGGYEAYVVGGCVRDCLMGRTPSDWDITTSALPEQIAEVFVGYRTLDTGMKHGTVTVIVEDMPLEITTYRVDGTYSDGRHPDAVTFTPSLTEDLRRRDFTVNAMAYHPDVGMVDPFGGQGDLQATIIRCVGDPKKRFSEDALRIMRGIRFSATLGFSIESATADAIHQLAPSLHQVARERITVELTKLLCGAHADDVLCRYGDVLSAVLICPVDLRQVAQYVRYTADSPLSRFGALFFDCSPEDVERAAHALRLSNRMTSDLLTLIRNRHIPLIPSNRHIARALHQLGPELLLTLIDLRSAYDRADYSDYCACVRRLLSEGVCYSLTDLAVNGVDLLSLGIQPGPAVGNALDTLLEAVMDGKCANDRDALLTYIQK